MNLMYKIIIELEGVGTDTEGWRVEGEVRITSGVHLLSYLECLTSLSATAINNFKKNKRRDNFKRYD